MNHLTQWAEYAALGVAALALLGIVARLVTRVSKAKAATLALAAPGALALGMSAYTSYLYFGQRLGITGWERVPLCAIGEAGILALTVYAWATKRRSVALLAYALVLIQAIPAFSLSAGAGGIVRIALGPVMLAAVLHLALGLEVRLSGIRRDTIWRRAAAELRERITSYLGIGRRGADSAAIARSRAADRAVRHACRATPRTERRRTRRAAIVARSVDAALHGLDDAARTEAERAIVARIDRRKSVGALWSDTRSYDWRAMAHDDALIVTRTETFDTPCERPCERPEEDGEPNALDRTMNSAALLAHEPPPWSSLSLREAVAKADEILPGRTGAALALALSEVGVHTTASSVRSTRSALRKAGKDTEIS